MKKLLALLLLFTTLNLYASEAAKIVDVRGEVQILGSDGNSRKAQKDEFVDVDEVITTFKKSFIKLQFIDNSLTTLGPESELRVEVFSPEAPGVLNLVKGSLRSKVTKDYMKISPSSSKLFIKTKSASMGVRGTEFLWTYDPSMDQTGIVTIEGVVRFVRFNSDADSNTVDAKKLDELLNSKNAVTVTKGQGSYSHPKIEKGVAPSEDLPLDLMREIRRMDLTALSSKSINNSIISKSRSDKNNKDIVKNNKDSLKEEKPIVDNSQNGIVSRDLKEDNAFKNLTALEQRSDVANDSIGKGRDQGTLSVSNSNVTNLAFPLKEELVSSSDKEEKDVEKEVNKKLKELEKLQESEDLESVKARAAKRKLEEQELLSIGLREKNKDRSTKAKLANDLNEEALKRERLKAGYVPNLKEQEVRLSDLDLRNPKNALNEADGKLDAETEKQLAEQAKKSELDVNATSVISGYVNKYSNVISSTKDTVAVIGAEVYDNSGSGSTSSGSGSSDDSSSSTTSLTDNSGSGSTSSGSSSGGTLRKIASTVYNTLTDSNSSTAGDTVSDAEAEQKLKEEALKREYEACIIEYKKKNRLAPTAPMSAFLKRQQDAQAFCNEKVYGSGTDTTTTTDPASTGK